MLVDDVVRMRELVAENGYGLKEIWSENIFVLDNNGVEIPTAFVLKDSEGREIDAHAMHLDQYGKGIPAWSNDGLIFKKADLAVKGFLAGISIPCISLETQLLCHLGYELPEVQQRDLELLKEKFGGNLQDTN